MGLLKTGLSTENYYRTFNKVYLKTFGEYYMLHYPLSLKKEDDFFQCQKNLTDYCISKIGDLGGKNVLEIGCGNGIQSLYIMNKYKPESITGIDLNAENIRIAKSEAKKKGIKKVRFFVGNAQELSEVKDNEVDVLLNIESAFHYPDKSRFLYQVHRVLKPGGMFVIADILKKRSEDVKQGIWKRKMHFFHWDLGRYVDAIEKSGLELEEYEDITEKIIHSFSHCIEWFRESRVIKNLFTRIWGIIMLRLNRYLLIKNQSYFIFVGKKPEPVY